MRTLKEKKVIENSVHLVRGCSKYKLDLLMFTNESLGAGKVIK